MSSINEDISKLTTIPKSFLCRLSEVEELCIANQVIESVHAGNDFVSVDIGIGTLSILLCDDTLKYKFTPNSTLDSKIVKAIKNNSNPLVEKIEAELASRIVNTYKNLL